MIHLEPIIRSAKIFFFLFFINLSYSQSASYIIGLTNLPKTNLGTDIENCTPSHDLLVDQSTIVVLIGERVCDATSIFELAYDGTIYFADAESINLTSEEYSKLSNREPNNYSDDVTDAINFSIDLGKARNQAIHDKDLRRKKLRIESDKAGFYLTDCEIFDQGDYTDATGFNLTITNTFSKTIKYVWFTVLGINSVGDSVSTVVLKGIGPIQKGNSGSYSFDYAWQTDIVHSFKINNVKIQYMDKTVRTIKNGSKYILHDGQF